MEAAILGKNARDTLRGFHVITRNFARNLSSRALQTVAFERFREIREKTTPSNATYVWHLHKRVRFLAVIIFTNRL